MPTQWMTRREAAAYLRVSPATIDRYARLGRLPKHKIGSRPVFKKEDLDALPTREAEDGNVLATPRAS